MPLAPDLKALLVCPKCKGELLFFDDRPHQPEVQCARCRLAYDVRDGVPVMLIEEARPLPG